MIALCEGNPLLVKIVVCFFKAILRSSKSKLKHRNRNGQGARLAADYEDRINTKKITNDFVFEWEQRCRLS